MGIPAGAYAKGSVVGNAGQSGAQPYRATELDWLVLELNSCCRDIVPGEAKLGFHYLAQPPSTVVIWGRFFPESNAAMIRSKTDEFAVAARAAASHHGFKWLKVSEDVQVYGK